MCLNFPLEAGILNNDEAKEARCRQPSKKGTTAEEYMRFWVYMLECTSRLADNKGEAQPRPLELCLSFVPVGIEHHWCDCQYFSTLHGDLVKVGCSFALISLLQVGCHGATGSQPPSQHAKLDSARLPLRPAVSLLMCRCRKGSGGL